MIHAPDKKCAKHNMLSSLKLLDVNICTSNDTPLPLSSPVRHEHLLYCDQVLAIQRMYQQVLLVSERVVTASFAHHGRYG